MKNELAFPTGTGGNTPYHQGMTLRDYFAAKALPALYADYVHEAREEGGRVEIGDVGEPGITSEMIALECYAIADAMMQARSA